MTITNTQNFANKQSGQRNVSSYDGQMTMTDMQESSESNKNPSVDVISKQIAGHNNKSQPVVTNESGKRYGR